MTMGHNITPPSLHKGDKVVILSTARRVSVEELSVGIAILQTWGLNVTLADNLLAVDNQFAGDTQARAHDLQQAIDDEDIKAIFCARGGYGTVKILDRINFESLSMHPKWIVGFSDVTALHCKLATICVESVHGPMVLTMNNASEQSLHALHKILFGENEDFVALKNGDLQDTHDEPRRNSLNRAGTAEGELTGGNLSVIYSLMGSDCEIDTDGKILFIEDVDEYLYHIDRMMECLKRAGKLTNLKGLIVGAFSGMKDNAISFGMSAEEIIYDAVSEFDYPVCFGASFGHIDNNLPLICGRVVSLTVNAGDTTIKFAPPVYQDLHKKDVRNIVKVLLFFVIFFLAIYLLIGVFARMW